MRRIFFYGLFMDTALLRGKGLHPRVVGRAVLADHRIIIGQKATLVPATGHRVCGLVMDLAADEAAALYAEPGVTEYVPERVRVRMLDASGTSEAMCYNLPRDVEVAGANPAYARELSGLLAALQFAPDYVAEVAALGTPRR